ncbi:hypothetical protein [Angustibacter luteus]|uniref:Uncharacterized protein n=1 Tax=Angustibacter luteus TaxID=658456 RepID=A0ABW1JEB6_9ACTN
MGSYAGSLATVVALLVTAAAAAALAAAVTLIAASVRRRRTLEWASATAAQLGRAMSEPHEGAAPTVDEEPHAAGRPATLRDRRPQEWADLRVLRSGGSAIPALDELDGMPTELVTWAAAHGPESVRRDLPVAMDLLAVDRDVRSHPAAGDEPDESLAPPPDPLPPQPDDGEVEPSTEEQRLARQRQIAADRIAMLKRIAARTGSKSLKPE